MIASKKILNIFLNIILALIVIYGIISLISIIIMMFVIPSMGADILIWMLFLLIGTGLGYTIRHEQEVKERRK